MSAALLIANLLRVAREDLDGARALAALSNRNAIYLCEQSAEKLIRAVLTSESIHAGIKHQLEELVDKVPDENPLKGGLRAVEYLAAYATAYRYPTASGRIQQSPQPPRLQATMADLDRLIEDAARRFEVDLAQRDTPARNPSPLRTTP